MNRHNTLLPYQNHHQNDLFPQYPPSYPPPHPLPPSLMNLMHQQSSSSFQSLQPSSNLITSENNEGRLVEASRAKNNLFSQPPQELTLSQINMIFDQGNLCHDNNNTHNNEINAHNNNTHNYDNTTSQQFYPSRHSPKDTTYNTISANPPSNLQDYYGYYPPSNPLNPSHNLLPDFYPTECYNLSLFPPPNSPPSHFQNKPPFSVFNQQAISENSNAKYHSLSSFYQQLSTESISYISQASHNLSTNTDNNQPTNTDNSQPTNNSNNFIPPLDHNRHSFPTPPRISKALPLNKKPLLPEPNHYTLNSASNHSTVTTTAHTASSAIYWQNGFNTSSRNSNHSDKNYISNNSMSKASVPCKPSNIFGVLNNKDTYKRKNEGDVNMNNVTCSKTQRTFSETRGSKQAGLVSYPKHLYAEKRAWQEDLFEKAPPSKHNPNEGFEFKCFHAEWQNSISGPNNNNNNTINNNKSVNIKVGEKTSLLGEYKSWRKVDDGGKKYERLINECMQEDLRSRQKSREETVCDDNKWKDEMMERRQFSRGNSGSLERKNEEEKRIEALFEVKGNNVYKRMSEQMGRREGFIRLENTNSSLSRSEKWKSDKVLGIYSDFDRRESEDFKKSVKQKDCRLEDRYNEGWKGKEREKDGWRGEKEDTIIMNEFEEDKTWNKKTVDKWKNGVVDVVLTRNGELVPPLISLDILPPNKTAHSLLQNFKEDLFKNEKLNSHKNSGKGICMDKPIMDAMVLGDRMKQLEYMLEKGGASDVSHKDSDIREAREACNVGAKGDYKSGFKLENKGGYRDDSKLENKGGYRDDSKLENKGGYREDYELENKGGYKEDYKMENKGGYRDDYKFENKGGYRDDYKLENKGVYRDDYKLENKGGYRDDYKFENKGVYRDDYKLENKGGYRDDYKMENKGGYRDDYKLENKGGYRDDYKFENKGGYKEDYKFENKGGYRDDYKFENKGGYRDDYKMENKGGYRDDYKLENKGGYKFGNKGCYDDEEYRGGNRDEKECPDKQMLDNETLATVALFKEALIKLITNSIKQTNVDLAQNAHLMMQMRSDERRLVRGVQGMVEVASVRKIMDIITVIRSLSSSVTNVFIKQGGGRDGVLRQTCSRSVDKVVLCHLILLVKMHDHLHKRG